MTVLFPTSPLTTRNLKKSLGTDREGGLQYLDILAVNYYSFTITFQLREDIVSDDILKLCFNSMLTTKPLYQKRPAINNTDQEYISWRDH